MDSDNILSILSTLNGGQDSGAPAPAPAAPQTNVMQAAAAPPPPSPQFQDPTAQVAQAAAAASPPMPKPRRSLLDTIGRISDVLATVGGAHALYQPTLDARADRATAAADHDLATQKAQIDLATGKFNLSNSQTEVANGERSRFASVLAAVNDPEDAGNMPAMMAAAGLTDARYAPFVKMVQDNPETAKTLAGALGEGSTDKLGHNLYFGTGPNGKTVAYQIGDDGQPHILDFGGAGVTPSDPIKVVNTGDKTQIIGANGLPKKILPNTVSPNTAANNAQSNTNNIRTTTTQKEIAGMPARAQPGKTSGATTSSADALAALDNIQHGFDSLHSMGALAGDPNTPAGTMEGAFGRTALGQKVGAQFGNKAAQQRLDLQKNLASLQSVMLQSLPGSATRTKFEQEIQKQRLPDPMQMDYPTAQRVIGQLRAQYQRAAAAAQAEVSAKNVPAGGPRLSPQEAAKLPSGTPFTSLDGRPLVRP